MNNQTTNVILGVIVVAAIIGGVYYFSNNKLSTTPVTPTPVATPVTPSASAAAPSVATGSANFISQSTAVLDAQINPNGAQTSYWYEYGTTQSLGARSEVQLLGAGHATYGAPASVIGLKSNTTYYYRAVAENNMGTVDGAIASFTTTLTPPVAGNPPTVGTSTAVDISSNSATLRGSVNPENSKTAYWFEYGSDLSLGNATASSNEGANNTTASVEKTISNLASNTVYYFRLNAQNGYGTVNGPIRSFTTASATPPPKPAGDEPTADTDPATSITATGATLNGHVDPNGSATTYWFEYGRASLLGVFNLTEQTSEKAAGAGKDSKSFSAAITGLDTDATYYFRIVSKNQYGTDSGAIHRFTTKAK